MRTAWLTGASGAWGGAFAHALLEDGHDVLALGRRDVPELAARAVASGLSWGFVEWDLAAPISLAEMQEAMPRPFQTMPDVLIHAAVSIEGDRAALAGADYLAPAGLIEGVAHGMLERGSGRIGVLVPQNARLGLAGLGDLSGAQAALWTWCEAKRDELAHDARDVALTIVIPPRTASATQRFVAGRSGHSARLQPPDASGRLRAILAGDRRAGRRPILAALAMLFR